MKTVLNPLNLYLNYFSQMQFFIKKILKNNLRNVLRILSKNVEGEFHELELYIWSKIPSKCISDQLLCGSNFV